MTSPQCATGFGKNTIRLLHGKRFITDAMLSEAARVSRRTTQDYRDGGLLPYYRLDGKILYAEEDIEIFLQSTTDLNSTELLLTLYCIIVEVSNNFVPLRIR